MARRAYSDSDRARVFAELTVNEGNIKRTARNLSMPVSTVRYFKTQWEKEGLEASVLEALPAVIENSIEQMERIQDKLLIAIEKALDNGDIRGRELFTGFGIVHDKIRAIKGLDTRRVEHTFELPDANEVRQLFGGVIQELVGAAQERAAEIEDADWEPADQKALSAPS